MTNGLLKINWPKEIEQLFQDYGRNRLFLDRYVINAVLSYIEEREQELILGMQYDSFVKIGDNERDEIIDRIINYLDRFFIACKNKGISEVGINIEELRKLIKDSLIVEKAICYLYFKGIYDDCVSRYLLIKVDGLKLPDLKIEKKG